MIYTGTLLLMHVKREAFLRQGTKDILMTGDASPGMVTDPGVDSAYSHFLKNAGIGSSSWIVVEGLRCYAFGIGSDVLHIKIV